MDEEATHVITIRYGCSPLEEYSVTEEYAEFVRRSLMRSDSVSVSFPHKNGVALIRVEKVFSFNATELKAKVTS
jgi:hypothetical protein